MKIIHIIWSLAYGGIETMLVNIANHQAALGNDVSIIVVNNKVEDKIKGKLSQCVQIYQLDRIVKSRSFNFLIKLNKILKSKQPDIIHLHSVHLYYMVFSQWRDKMCCTMHDIPFDKRSFLGKSILPNLGLANLFIKQSTNIQNLHKFKHVFAISKSVQDVLIDSFNIKSIVIDNGIDVDSFKVRDHKLFEGPYLKIIQVSRLDHDKKGQDILINAISKLKNKINIKVDFIGEGASLDYLKNISVEKGIQDNVNFLGSRTQNYIAEHLSEYDLLVQPSRIEGFGLTVAEGIAAGVPVLVSSGEGPAEIICNGKYGWLFKRGDITSLAEMIEFICNHKDETECKRHLALKHIQDNYSVLSTAINYIKAYRNIYKNNL